MKKYGHPRFYELLKELAEIHSAKNHDYASQDDPLANLKECERIGIEPFVGCFVRMMDKYMRIANFINAGELKVKDESIKDTLRDLAVYSLIAIILFEEQKNG